MKPNQTPTTQKPIRNVLAGDYFRTQVALALPKHMTPDRFVRVCLTAITRIPKLAQCTEASVIQCMMTCSELGLEPDGRRAHLIPFENKRAGTTECTLIIDYKGLAELALRSGKISKLHADVICENDEFAYDMGEILHHRIDFRKDRGEPYAAYALAQTTDGAKFVQVLTKAEIEGIRNRSQGWIAFTKGWAHQSPWKDFPNEQWKKTAFRRLSKWLPLSPEIHDNLDRETDTTTVSSARSLMLEMPAEVLEQQPAIEATAGPVEQQEDETASAPVPAEASASADPAEPAQSTPQQDLEFLVTANDYTIEQFHRWGETSGVVPDASSYATFSELSTDLAQRLLRAKAGLLRGLKMAKEGKV